MRLCLKQLRACETGTATHMSSLSAQHETGALKCYTNVVTVVANKI